MQKTNLILAVNTGSSSIKLGIYLEDLTLVAKMSVTDIGYETSFFVDKAGVVNSLEDSISSHEQAIDYLLNKLEQEGLDHEVVAIGHRVVFSVGDNTACEINDELISKLRQDAEFDDDHMPYIVKNIELLRNKFPDVKHVACFDSEFFNDLPVSAQTLALPEKFRSQGVRKKGFHGLSYESLLAQLPGGGKSHRIVIAHLGSGCSLSAVANGSAVDTTMVFSPNSGVIMSTRSGSIDPSIVKYIAEKNGLNLRQVDEILNKQSGIKAISGGETDMHELVQGYQTNSNYRLAVDVFCTEISKQIAAMAAIMGGLDMLIFAGGIGQKSAFVRKKVCENLTFMNIEIDDILSQKSHNLISKDGRVEVRVMATDEELMIASKSKKILKL